MTGYVDTTRLERTRTVTMDFDEQELALIERAEWRVTQALCLRGFCLAVLFAALGLYMADAITAEMLAGASVGLVFFASACPQWGPLTPRYAELVELLVRKRGKRDSRSLMEASPLASD